MNLFQIDAGLREVLLDIAFAQGEVTSEQEEQLESLQIRRTDKLGGYLRIIRHYELEEGKVQAEIDRLMGIRNGYAAQREKLTGILRKALAPGEEFEDDTSKLKTVWRRSEAVEFTGEVRKLPEQFIRYEETYSPKKVELKKHLEAGNEVEGAKIVERWHLKVS